MDPRTLLFASTIGLASFGVAACGGGATGAEGAIDPSGEDAGDIDAALDVADDTLDDTGVPIGTDADADAGPSKPDFDLNEANRKSCMFGPGSKTTTTIGPAVPHGGALPFEHVVVLTLENQSFDRYLSKLPEYGVTDVDVASDTDSNPDPATGKTVQRFHETRYCLVDVAHNWGPVHMQYDDGLMDGFVSTSNPGGARAMGYHDHTDIPYYYWLAKTFSISDRYFCSLLGPTWPNRFYFYGATSWGRTHTPDTPPLGKPKITNLLEDAGKSWKIYRNGTVSFALAFGPSVAHAGVSMDNFEKDIAADKLPHLSILDPNFSGGANGAQDDEHPPANVQKGQKLVKRVVDAIASNPAVWKKTVLFITYDEHGGFYDHVPPPEACEPDEHVPSDYKFDRYGIRVPLYVVSAFAKKGYVSHTVADHTSITRFIENRFDLPAMTKRDANAWPLLDMFDFENPPFPEPPTALAPSAEPSAEGLEWCKNNSPGTGMP